MTPRRVDAPHAWLRAVPGRLLCVLLLCGWFGLPHAEQAAGGWVHAYAAFGEPKYPRDFTHFDYVNPDAPKGGVIHLRNPDRRTSFDKFNYFTIRGNAPAGHGASSCSSRSPCSAPTSRARCTACWRRRCASSPT